MRFVVTAMLFASLCGSAQEPTGTGSLEGRVVDAISGDPIAAATVLLGGPQFKLERQIPTDAEGTFRVDGLPAGGYLLVGYAKNYRAVGSTPVVTIQAGQQKSGLVLSLSRLAMVRGRILSESDRPLAGATVQALMEQRQSGLRRLTTVKSVDTDANGQYQLDGLVAGKYYIVAQKKNDGLRVYFPSATSVEQAQPVTLNFAQDYVGADVHLRAVALHAIEGQVHGLEYLPRGQNVKLRLRPLNPLDADASSREGVLGLDGRFRFEGVQPGNYLVLLQGTTQAGNFAPGSQAMFVHVLAKQELQVAQSDVSDFSLAVSAGANVTGRVELDQANAGDLAATQIDLRPAESFSFSDYKSVKAGADGTFMIAACDPARHSLHVVPPAGTYVEQIQFNRQVATTRFLDFSNAAGGELLIRLRRGTAGFSGTLANGVNNAFVLLIPAEWTADDWHEAMQTQARDGSFRFAYVPPGNYVTVATQWRDRDSRELQDPEVIHALLQEGRIVELTSGMQKNMEVPVLTDGSVAQLVARIGM